MVVEDGGVPPGIEDARARTAVHYKPFADWTERAAEVAPSYANTPERRAVLEAALASIDQGRWQAVLAKYDRKLRAFNDRGIYKYADIPYWVAHKLERAWLLGLHRRPAPLDILDIGMGAGHLGVVARALGHRYMGTDIAVPFYAALATAMGVERRIEPVRRRVPHPDFGRRFDLVTMIWHKFDDIRREDGSLGYWPLADWLFLLADLAENQLQPGGSIYIELNRQLLPGSPFHPELMAWADARGAIVDAAAGRILFADVQPGIGYFTVDGPIVRQDRVSSQPTVPIEASEPPRGRTILDRVRAGFTRQD